MFKVIAKLLLGFYLISSTSVASASSFYPKNHIVIDLSKNMLKPKGVLVSKLFMGEDFIEVKSLAKSVFKTVNFFKPASSRRESKETYLHCEFLKSL